MSEEFGRIVLVLESRLKTLLEMPPVSFSKFPKVIPEKGVYLLSEGGNHLYTGRSNRIRKRLRNHCRSSASHHMATFAFRLAREATGRVKATYRKDGGRLHLTSIPEFAEAFTNSKRRVRAMDVRFVAEPDPLNQALLEIYVSVCLRTPYNDFDTH